MSAKQEEPDQALPWVPNTLRALRHRNYRLLIFGQLISLTGSWMQSTAQGWLVYQLTDSKFLLGLVGFASQVPVLALGVLGGVVADAMSRHRTVLITQILLMVQALLLAVLTLVPGPDGRPLIQVWHIILLAVFAGSVQAFDMPARQAFLVQVVPKYDINNAIALNSLTFNAARVFGPALAGMLIAIMQGLARTRQNFGEGMCFLINALSFVAVIVQLMRMDASAKQLRPVGPTTEADLASALHYLRHRLHLRALMYHAGAVALLGLPYLVLLPAVAKDTLGGDSRMLGWLTTSVGVGAMTGGVLMARRKHIQGLGKVIAGATAAFGLTVIVVAQTSTPWLACVGFGIAGLCMVSAMISSQTLVQSLVSENYRGRVMSFYSMMTIGMMPFGSLLVGGFAEHFNVQKALMLSGFGCIGIAAAFAWYLPAIRAAARSSPEYSSFSSGAKQK